MSTLPSRISPDSRGEQRLFQFFLMDLEECQTFIDLVETELRLTHSQAAVRAFRNADHSYQTILRFLSQPEYERLRDEIERSMAEVANALEDLRLKLNLLDQGTDLPPFSA